MRLPPARFTVRSMMIAVAVLAAAFAAFEAWIQTDLNPWRRHLNTEIRWSRSPVGQFYGKRGLEKRAANSLLKIAAPGTPDPRGYYNAERWSLGQGGELYSESRFRGFYSNGSAGGERLLTSAELAEVEQIISKLPLAQESHPQGDLLLVSARNEDSWVTIAYNIGALPPAVKELVRVLQLRLR